VKDFCLSLARRKMVRSVRSTAGRRPSRRPIRALALFLVVFGCAPLHRGSGRPDPSEAEAWVDATLADLPLRRKVAQMVFPRIPGAFLPTESATYQRIEDWVATQGVGGLIATIGPPMEAASTFNVLQGLADVPLLITADMENGPGQLLNGGTVLPYGLENGGATRFPPVMGLAATGDERFAYELGRVTALEARAVGVHMTFAPVVDVNNNPANPIINTRSYGADATRVARFAAAHVRGLQENGLLATAKHFPGHGDTGTDSHIELPVITVNTTRADSVELVPYRAAIEAGVAGVMSAHIAFPALTGDSIPATLNARILTGLLRERLGFEGIITTDAMDMGAIVRRWGARDASVLAVKAGADLLLQVNPEDVAPVIDAVVAAVQRGEISVSRIDASVRRILAAKARVGLHVQRTVDLTAVPKALSTRRHIELANDAADRSITAVRDRDLLLPLRGKVLSIVFAGDVDPWTGRTFQRALRQAMPSVDTAMLTQTSAPAEIERVRAMAKIADVVLIAPFIRVGAYKENLAVPEPVASLIGDLIRMRPTALVSFGNPYLLTQFPEVGTYVLAWGQWEAPQRAAARAVVGIIPITGRLPIPLPPEYDIGGGITIEPGARERQPASPLRSAPVAPLPSALPDEVGFDAALPSDVDRVVRQGILDGAAPGVAVAVGRRGKLVVGMGEGHLDRPDGKSEVTDSTIFDIASLTKVVATTTAVMLLVDDGLLDLDGPVSRYLPEWAGAPERAAVTIRHLLLHSSGLPAWEPFYNELRGRTPYLLAIARTPLRFEPGTSTEYSDLGAILLGLIVERVSGEPLDVLLQERVFGPLGMRDTGFMPTAWTAEGRADAGDAREDKNTRSLFARIAPTEVDTLFRFRHLRGEVHDENAWAMGGVAGHAGLFSSARDLARFAQLLLGGGSYGHLRLIREETVRAFTRRQSSASSRALGWDTPSSGSSAGDQFSRGSFGHTGYTGTSLWIDPERDLFVVLLTNRVNPSRDNPRLGPMRKALHNTVQKSVRDAVLTDRGS
jgi:beta-glucosidase-like glycosyl hydrolase/CubicO group peptidase (beta-lactamase class C family)